VTHDRKAISEAARAAIAHRMAEIGRPSAAALHRL
jgi:1-acyl-sn-glycerol-3-phosphate acyltransferase